MLELAAMNRLLNFACIGMALLFLALLAGCGPGVSPASSIRNSNKTNSQKLSNLYAFYQLKNKLQGPKDETAFKEFLNGSGSSVLDAIGVEAGEVDAMFVCERDGEPFRIRYGVPTGPRGSQEAVVFETTGKHGKRMVGFLNMVQREVEDGEYESMWNANVVARPRVEDRGPG